MRGFWGALEGVKGKFGCGKGLDEAACGEGVCDTPSIYTDRLCIGYFRRLSLQLSLGTRWTQHKSPL